MSEQTTLQPGPWQVSNNGSGKRIWFVWRPQDSRYPHSLMQVLSSPDGKYRRFATAAAARAAMPVKT